jgi:hypothetical protein
LPPAMGLKWWTQAASWFHHSCHAGFNTRLKKRRPGIIHIKQYGNLEHDPIICHISHIKTISHNNIWLVIGGIPTHLKNMSSSVGKDYPIYYGKYPAVF